MVAPTILKRIRGPQLFTGEYLTNHLLTEGRIEGSTAADKAMHCLSATTSRESIATSYSDSLLGSRKLRIIVGRPSKRIFSKAERSLRFPVTRNKDGAGQGRASID